ncbi:MAG: PEP/pyruvate-binding domain-containing protein [Planctomycetaceae bacterium]
MEELHSQGTLDSHRGDQRRGLVFFFGDGASDGDPAWRDILGGKGASLAAMCRAGLPVPPGFTISAECCRDFHAAGRKWPERLEEEIRAGLARIEQATGRPYGELATRHSSLVTPLLLSIRSGAAVSMPGMMDTLLNCGWSTELADAAENPQCAWEEYAEFTRSFARTIANLPESAFAEIDREHEPHAHREKAEAYRRLYEECAGRPFPIDPWDALAGCIDAVFDSWHSERARVYRRHHDIRGLPGTAVTVQAMFPSELSGIVFTRNPNNPLGDEMVIESSYGLGEAVVSGAVTPDTFILDCFTRERKSVTLGSRSVIPSAGGSHTDGNGQPVPSLDDDQLDELARLAQRVETFFGHPVDIEWGRANGRLALLQSRAIRGLDIALDVEVGRKAEIERLRDLAAGKRKVWVVHNLSETLPAPTPLTWDVIGGFMRGDGGFGRMYRDFGYSPGEEVRRDGFLELICGRIYADPDRVASLFWEGMPFAYDLDAISGDPSLLDSAPDSFDAARADGAFLLRLPRNVWTMLRASRRMKRARKNAVAKFAAALEPFREYVAAKRRMDISTLSTDAVIAELRGRIARVLDDFGGESLKPGFFGGVARAALEQRLVLLLGEQAGQELVAELTSGLEGDTTMEQNILLARVAADQATLDEFLERFGHRAVGEMELANPRWREDPSYLENLIATYRRRAIPSPEARHEANREKRLVAERKLPETLAHWGGGSFFEEVEVLMREAQTLLPYREIGKHWLMTGYETIRAALVELARRWDLGRDAFFLHLDDLDRFENERDWLEREIAQRKMRWQSAQRLDHPQIVDTADLDRLGLRREIAAANEIQGHILSAGVAAGTARHVFDPNEAGDLGTDAILICPSTDPGWTALFANIRGLVVERGGALSHGAITARDFGLPALACPDATRLIPNGARVRIDGNHGTVTVMEGRGSRTQ